MNTFEEIQTALDALVAKMIDKGVERPSAGFTMNANSEKKYIYLCSSGRSLGGGGSTFFHADTPAYCFKDAKAFIDNLPSPEEAVTQEYLARVASAVDYATEHSLPDEYVAPLRGVSVAMTSNLLTKQGGDV